MAARLGLVILLRVCIILLRVCIILSCVCLKMTTTHRIEMTQYALKGQKPIAQGIALGNQERQPVALKGQKHKRKYNYSSL